MKSVIDDITTYYASAAYQVKTDGTYTNTRKYYSFNGAVVAMRENGVITWLLQDQVNSTTVTADADGSFASEIRYSAYGEVRYSNGTTVTDKLYTGQQQETEIGLDYYIARFYDPVIGHFIQPDSLIPQASASASYDRYAYVNGNPVNFNDPSGHAMADYALGIEWLGYGPTRILDAYAGDDLRLDEALRDFTRDHPEYNPATDAALDGTTYFLYQNAKFQAQAQDGAIIFKDAVNLAFAGMAFSDPGDIASGISDAGLILSAIGKKIPNPFGKLGGPAHKNTVQAVKDELDAKFLGTGATITGEYGINTPGGVKPRRYADVAVLDKTGRVIELVQVGKVNKNGLPVAREQYAINDIRNYGRVQNIKFKPYNK